MSKRLPRSDTSIGSAFVHGYGANGKVHLRELDNLRALPTLAECLWGWQHKPPGWVQNRLGLVGAPGFSVVAPSVPQLRGARRPLPYWPVAQLPDRRAHDHPFSQTAREWMCAELGRIGIVPSEERHWKDVSDDTLRDSYFGNVGWFTLAVSHPPPLSQTQVPPGAREPIRVQCTGAAAYAIPAKTDCWHLVCSDHCYGPTGCLVETTEVDWHGRAPSGTACQTRVCGAAYQPTRCSGLRRSCGTCHVACPVPPPGANRHAEAF